MLVIDSDILIDAARNDATATRFLAAASSENSLAISSITRLELLAGCRNRSEWDATERALDAFTSLPLTESISATALDLFRRYRLSHGLGVADALIAATAISHQAALASKNRRHFRALTELTLIAYPPT